MSDTDANVNEPDPSEVFSDVEELYESTEMEVVEPLVNDFEDYIEYRKQQEEPKVYKDDPNTGKTYMVVDALEHDEVYALYAGPNEVFFPESGTRRASRSQSVNDPLNQGKLFSHVGSLKTERDAMFWAFLAEQHVDNLCIDCQMEINQGIIPPTLEVVVDGEHKVKVVAADNEPDKYTFSIKMTDLHSGYHTLVMRIVKNPSKRYIGNFEYVKLTSDDPLAIVRERWRPLAAHCGFGTQKLRVITAWVTSVKKHPDSLGAFFPFNTPFGYSGSPMKFNGKASGKNFSFWTAGRTQPYPARYRWSRLLGAGSHKAKFSEFTHEGKGVKLRGYNPWENNVSGELVSALTMTIEPAPDGNPGFIGTYYDYCWDEKYEEFRLFGIGQKWSMNKAKLCMTTFVEVAGVAESQRTNHNVRKIYYDGYARDGKNRWKKLVSLTRRGGAREYTNQDWGIENGKFYMSCGGLEQRKNSTIPKKFKLQDTGERPLYMHPDKLKVIDQPITFPKFITQQLNKEKKQLTLRYHTGDVYGDLIKVVVYYGNDDGLTIERVWDYSVATKSVEKGENLITFTYKGNKVPTMCRIKVVAERSQLWSYETTLISDE